jgi:hypothetical protein
MANERKTEDIVRRSLSKAGYYGDGNLVVEEQQSESLKIDKLLKNASKKGGPKGYPEFIIRSKDVADFLIVIECKADNRKHISKTLDKYAAYAVDGVLLYASYLRKEYDVLAIAVSGETKSTLRISHYLCLRGSDKPVELSVDTLLSFKNYHRNYLLNEAKLRQDYDALLVYSRELNEDLHARQIPEADRSMLISGILVALENEAFKKGYKVHNTAQELADSLVNSVVSEFMRSGLPQERIKNLKHAFSFIQVNATITADKDFFVGLIEQIDQNVKRFLATDQFYDAIGQFYVQFLRYANNDKGLGIVLTPAHIAELFADLAEVGKKSVVYDNCCGTAGLLIAAMKRMLKDAKSDEETEKAIKDQQLIGVEFQPHIYALAVSNMVVHRDGKTSIKNGDCFTLTSQIRDKYKPTVGVLNPPYQTKNNPIHELEFVLNNLETLQPNGKCIAIVPFSCAIGEDRETSDRKRRIMEAHTLEGVMTMPADLFHDSDTNVVTCIMVITAHKPHPKGKKTWFGYWRNDGFIKVKNKGRIDADGRWDSIKTGWLTAYRNKTEIKGLGVMKEVSATDEWCAEAYMEPDWSRLNRDELTKTFKEFAVHRLLMETGHA